MLSFSGCSALSRYRRLVDLPIGGLPMRLVVTLAVHARNRELRSSNRYDLDRGPATAEAWLAAQPEIAVVPRERGGAYAVATARAPPGALLVADSWHLVEKMSPASCLAI